MNTPDNASYQAAKAELEKIVNALKQGTADIDRMAEDVKRATALLKTCEARLREVEAQVLPEVDAAG